MRATGVLSRRPTAIMSSSSRKCSLPGCRKCRGHGSAIPPALAGAELRHAEVVPQVPGGHADHLVLRDDQLLDRLADQGGELTLEVAHARLARVAADGGEQRVLVDRP